MNRALLWFVRVWVGIVIAVNVISVVGIFGGAHGFRDGWQQIAEIYSPFNLKNYLLELVLVSPAIGAYAWLERRRKPAAERAAEEVKQIVNAYGAAMTEPWGSVRDLRAYPFSIERLKQGLLKHMSEPEARREANEFANLAAGSSVLRDVGALPYPKERIKRALLRAIALTPPGPAREQLKVGFVSLGDWQNINASDDPTAAMLAEGKALLAELRSLGL